MDLASEGRLFRLKLDHSRRSREEALATIRQVPPLGLWQVRVGGRMKGRTVVTLTKATLMQWPHGRRAARAPA